MSRGSWRGQWSKSRRGPCSSPGAYPKPSPPRTSPTTIPSGLIRREFRTKSRMVIAPFPSMFGGRLSRGDNMLLPQLKLRRIFNSHDPFIGRG